MQNILNKLSSILPLQDDVEIVLNDIEPYLRMIKETINYRYRNEQSYVYKKLTPFSPNLLLRRFLINLLQTSLSNSIAHSSNKWIDALWEDHHLLFLVTFTRSKEKIIV